MLQCVLECCSVAVTCQCVYSEGVIDRNSQFVALSCSLLQNVAVCCSLLQCVNDIRIVEALQHVATHCIATCCSVLQCVNDNTLYCNVLLHVAVRVPLLQCVAVCCSVLQCVAVCCSMLQYVAVCCSMLQYVAVCCSVLHCNAMCCYVLQCFYNEDVIYSKFHFVEVL